MLNPQDIKNLLIQIFESETFILASLSGSRTPNNAKVTIRPILLKGQSHYQLTEQQGPQAVHRNFSKKECLNWLNDHLMQYKQTLLYTAASDYHLLINKKGVMTLLKKASSKTLQVQAHNRQKEYILQEGTPIPFLMHLGIMNQEGKVHVAKRDKFRQINRFLEMIDDILPHLNLSKPLNIIDFGCGKAYLTFALYHFLKIIKNCQLHLTGLDLKKEVIQDCQELAKQLGYQQDLHFIWGDINHFNTDKQVDLMVSLHACDTATDAALEKAIRWKSKVILSVPCCQHELLSQVDQPVLRPLLKHGILKERFSALVTDAARAQLLEVLGYQTQIIEFIDFEHTPKNLLIRAVRRFQKGNVLLAWQTYLEFKSSLAIEPSLEKRFQSELNQLKFNRL